MTDKTMNVSSESYTDTINGEAEMELMFKRVPLMLAFTAELPNPGDYKAMDAVGMPVLINRNKAGQGPCIPQRLLAPAARRRRRRPWQLPALHLQISRLDLWAGRQADRHCRSQQLRRGRQIGDAACANCRAKRSAGMIFVCLTPDAPIDLDGYFRGYPRRF